MSSKTITDPLTRRVVWVMIGIMMLSFLFGIGMFLPAEHRAEKLKETMHRYQARNPDVDQVQPEPKKRIRY